MLPCQDLGQARPQPVLFVSSVARSVAPPLVLVALIGYKRAAAIRIRATQARLAGRPLSALDAILERGVARETGPRIRRVPGVLHFAKYERQGDLRFAPPCHAKAISREALPTVFL